MNLEQFIAERTRNAEYYGVDIHEMGLTERHECIINAIGHLLEEAVELRMHVPRRPWRNDELSPLEDENQRQAALLELVDVILLWGNVAVYLGFDAAEIENAIKQKIAYNKTRLDHAKDKHPGQ